MDYYKIGQRIRHYRKALDFSQEQLAETVGISTTHMSHIETGNTKLSLPVLVTIAEALGVQTDSILFDEPPKKAKNNAELQELIDSCSPRELAILLETARALRIALEKHL